MPFVKNLIIDPLAPCANIITASIQIMRAMIEGIGFIARFNNTGQIIHRHIHQARLRVVFHLFLSIERHCGDF